MALKFQFQFAGADFSRPSSPQRKWLRLGVISMVAALAGLAGYEYLHHLLHHPAPVAVHVTPAVPHAGVPNPVKPAAPAAPPALKKAADEAIVAVGGYLTAAAKMSPAVPTATVAAPPQAVPSQPVAKPITKAVAAPVVMAAPKPVAPRPLRVHTEQERLLMAGETALGNVIDLANKYPDAYGFQAGDFLSDAKLGEPVPVYTIQESDRANYRNGQPVKPLLKPAKRWVFPVMMGDRICCMVEVTQVGHDYVPGTGNKSLGMEWGKILEKWPAAEGFHPMLVVNPAVPGYYFTVPELPVQNLTDTIEMFYLHPGFSPADVILASWR